MFYDQSQYDIRCEWGEKGVRALASGSDVVIIVDVFSFSTTVDIALSRGAVVFPFQRVDTVDPQKIAQEKKADLVGKLPGAKYSFRPKAMFDILKNARLAISSPNGAAISLMAGEVPTLTACFRNRRAVAEYACKTGKKLALIPCGERWEDNSLRPGLEDWLAAGAIISALPGTRSPEAAAAAATFETMRSDLQSILKNSSSGRELLQNRHDDDDAEIAAQIDFSDCVPRLIDGAFIDAAKREVTR